MCKYELGWDIGPTFWWAPPPGPVRHPIPWAIPRRAGNLYTYIHAVIAKICTFLYKMCLRYLVGTYVQSCWTSANLKLILSTDLPDIRIFWQWRNLSDIYNVTFSTLPYLFYNNPIVLLTMTRPKVFYSLSTYVRTYDMGNEERGVQKNTSPYTTLNSRE